MSLCTTSSQEVKKTGRVVYDGKLRLIEILRISLLKIKDLPLRTSRNPQKIRLSVSLDNDRIHETTASASKSIYNLNDGFVHEIESNFSKLHITVCEDGGPPRPIGRLSLKKREIVKHSGKSLWHSFLPVTKENDICGQINVDMQYDRDTSRLSLKVLNYAGLNVSGPFYLVVTLQGVRREASSKSKDSAVDDVPKLKIGQKKDGLQDGDDKLIIECAHLETCGSTPPQLRMSLWREVPNSPNSEFYGEVCVSLDASVFANGPQWYNLKPRGSPKDQESSKKGGVGKLGQIYLELYYTADHILPLESYQILHRNLIDSLEFHPFCSSLVGILEYLPSIDLTCLARPLMKIFFNNDNISSLIRIFGAQDIQNCSDVNTLFRSQSMTSTIVYEEMKFLGQTYLSNSLKPLIDKIYNEKKCCEIDPSKLRHGDDLEMNMRNLLFYGEMAFSGMVESFQKCPAPLRQTFADLRALVAHFHPAHDELQHVAVSSFIVLRFFAAALVNPKLFGLKREQPDAVTSRTLVLVSKILQRASNSAVSVKALSSKEQWFKSVLHRFTDEKHRKAMLKFLDGISLAEDSNANGSDNHSIVCSGVCKTRLKRAPKRKVLTNLVHQKRFVALTEKELWWKKNADDEERMGKIDLHKITLIEPVKKVKNGFRIASSEYDLSLQAKSSSEMNEWLVQLQLRTQDRVKKEREERAEMDQSSDTASSCMLDSLDSYSLYDIDTERELEAIHMTLYEHAETLKNWKNALEGVEIPAGYEPLPQVVLEKLNMAEDPEMAKEQFRSMIENVLICTLFIEKSHQEAVDRFISQMRGNKGSQELFLGDDNYLLLKSRFQSNTE